MLTNLANKIVALHQECIIHWKKEDIVLHQQDFLKIVEENHAFNYQLWHAEDRARRDDMGFEFVYHAKRAIDHYNQQRNNCMEAMDAWLFRALNPAHHSTCSIHSETPGMIIDRLSILSLKVFHMALQLERVDVDTTHHQKCISKLQVLKAQQAQLHDCLHYFLEEIYNKTRTFRVYQQLKMYNDPSLNPELYLANG